MHDTSAAKQPARNAWTVALAGLGAFMDTAPASGGGTPVPPPLTRSSVRPSGPGLDQ
jgi:hypothetical protein